LSVAPTAALAQSVWTAIPNGSGTYPCGSTGSAIVLVVWDDVPTSGSTVLGYDRVAYTLKTVSGQTQLHRIACAGSATIVTDVVVAHDVDTLVVPVIACTSGGATVACSGAGASVPAQLSLTLSIKDAADTGAVDYRMTLTGQRRST
jgi:hypothetical protein